MSIRFYPAVIEHGDQPGFSVFFPDFPGCVSAGHTMQQAALNAEEALSGHVALMLSDGDPLPEPTSLDDLAPDPEVKESARLLVRLEVSGELIAA